MNIENTLEKLHELRLSGMYKSLEEQGKDPDTYDELSFADRLELLIEREKIERETRALQARIGKAKFKQSASLSDTRASATRGLDKTTLKQLSMCKWVMEKKNIIITGASGVGKTWLATALAHKACLLGHTSRYYRINHLLQEFDAARVEGRYQKLLAQIGRFKVLIIDDFCLSNMTEPEEKDLFEIVDERHRNTATIITSQNPVSVWHGLMPNPAIADAVLDRIVHGAIRIELKGESLRKKDAAVLDKPKPDK